MSRCSLEVRSRQMIKDLITKALHENFAEFTEDQALSVIEALKANGFTIIQNTITEKMETAAKQATGMGMYGYSMQSALDAMIEAQEQK